ncbi:MAG: bifunctional folylpolyglutamate synthase/dihydrofolate synthase [Bacteroidetes bacterium]|nr:bifunctional folylpolyglutamate synthase/dihydrofolate synthase [Bacteroidota bacterium]
MNYRQTLHYLFEKLPMYQRVGAAAYKANLDNTIALANALGNPENKFRSIHVAGTNGKGSVSHILASVCMEAGLKTGLYTSPHLLDFRERIMLNGKMIPESTVIDFVQNNQKIIELIQPSFFEITVIMAFAYFAHEKVDVAIIETGLGGRLDSTNIITPLASIITNISLEHEKLLGDSIEKIAKEKAGIIKKQTAVIIGEKKDSTKETFLSKAKETSSPLVFAEEQYAYNPHGIKDDQIDLELINLNTKAHFKLSCDLAGTYQGENICTCLTLFDTLKNELPISKDEILKGIANVKRNTSLRGRWEIMRKEPYMVFDISHNPVAITYMLEQLKSYTYNQLHIVFGMSDDKRIDDVLNLMPKEAIYYFAKPDVPRGMEAIKLQQNALTHHLMGESFVDVGEAIKASELNANKDDFILITGSAFVVADAMHFLNQ